MSGLEVDHGEPPDRVKCQIHALPVEGEENDDDDENGGQVVKFEKDLIDEVLFSDIRDVCDELIRLVEQNVDDDDDHHDVQRRPLPTSDVPDSALQRSPTISTLSIKEEEEEKDEDGNLVTTATNQVKDQLEVSLIPLTANSSSNLRKTVGSVLKSNADTVSEIISYVVKSSLAYKDSTSKCSKVGSSRKKRCLSPCQDKSVKKLKVESNAEESRKQKLKWAPGDIVWFKVREQPYWPGKISYDTDLNEYVRFKGGISEYYVTPFGRSDSGKWILAPQMLKFQGRVQYEEHVSLLINKLTDVCQKQQMAKFGIKESERKEWEKVVCRVENRCLKANSTCANGKPDLVKSSPLSKTKKRDVSASGEALQLQQDTQKKQNVNKRQKIVKTSPELTPPPSSSSSLSSTIPVNHQIRKKFSRQANGELAHTPSSQQNSGGSDGSISSEKFRRGGKKPDEFLPKSVADDEPLVMEKKRRIRRQRKKVAGMQSEYQAKLEMNGTGIEMKKDVEDPCVELKGSAMDPPGVAAKAFKPSNSEKTVRTVVKELKKTVNGRVPRAASSTKEDKPKKKHLNQSSCSDSVNYSGDSDSATDVKRDCSMEGKSDKVCQTCEKLIPVAGDGVRCTGGCYSIFHKMCAKPALEDQSPDTYKCELCIKGIHICFVCKKSEGEMRRCNTRMCGKYYHISCLSAFGAARTDGNAITCSLHSCLSCSLAKTRKAKSRLLRCFRCPVAYHPSDECLAAGSLFLSNQTILCPRHYEPSKNPKPRVVHVNVNWCFMCSTGGSLICCETCPASFHAECLHIEPPEESYYCLECLAGTQPKYGDIVWAKLGAYRWWPAKIFNPRNVPPNIRSIPHQPGQFPVCFFGTHDYYWTSRSRVFQFQEGDQGAHDNAGNRLAKLYEKALNEASVAYHEWKSAKECRDALDYERNNLQPPRFRFIKTNRPVGKVTIFTADPSQMTPCDCNPESEAPCGSDSDCLNRMLMFECHPAVCPAGERCLNQRFEKRQYVAAEVFRAEGKGWGLRSLADVKKGEFVNEYVGELIDEEECRRRMTKMHEENKTSYYFLTIDKDRIIDAAHKGNLSRFMNHSCQPNCETHKWTVNGDTRVGLFAVCDIPSGTELTFNYNLDCLGNEKTTCKCQAPNCSGFIGERPKNNVLSSKKSDKGSISRKKKRKTKFKNEHEDECYRCGLDGELLMCDRRNCPKAYHLSCLNLDKPPYGRWECPWHHCDICGKAASALCMICPNSFCKDHLTGNVFHTSSGTAYCTDHTNQEVVAYFSECSTTQDLPPSSSSRQLSTKKRITTTSAKCNLPANSEVLLNSKESTNKQLSSKLPVGKKPLPTRLQNGRKVTRSRCRAQISSIKSRKRKRNSTLVKKSKHDRLLNGTNTKQQKSSSKQHHQQLSVCKTNNDNLLGSKPMTSLALEKHVANDSVNSVIDSVVRASVNWKNAFTKKTTLNGKLKHLRIKPLVAEEQQQKTCSVNGVVLLNKVNGRVYKKKLHCDCDMVNKTVKQSKSVEQPEQQRAMADNLGVEVKKESEDSKLTFLSDSSVPNCTV